MADIIVFLFSRLRGGAVEGYLLYRVSSLGNVVCVHGSLGTSFAAARETAFWVDVEPGLSSDASRGNSSSVSLVCRKLAAHGSAITGPSAEL